MATNKIVAHYCDGRLIKGSTQNFDFNNAWFHLIADGSSHKATEVYMRELKAVFFVNDFEGQPKFDEKKDFTEAPATMGRRVTVTFKDGEMLVGTTLNFDPSGVGFFLIPADPRSNNKRVFVINSSIKDVALI